MSAAAPLAAVAMPTAAERAAIDRSCRGPVLLFAFSAVAWFVVHAIIAVLASHQVHAPSLFADTPWLTHGRLSSAAFATLMWGWAGLGGVAVGLWLQARLAGAPLVAGWLAASAGLVWNLALAVGLVQILVGNGSGVTWLEFPPDVNLALGLAMVAIAVCTLATYARRRPGHVYVSQWYLFAAFLWLPLCFAVANAALYGGAASGAVQAAAVAWFGHNVLTLWVTPIALAALYYFIPKVSGRPIASYPLALLGFWTLAAFATWGGTASLVGGPLPAWVPTVGVVGSVLLLVPVITVGLNQHLTLLGAFHLLERSVVLRCMVIGGVAYTCYGVLVALLALRSVAETTQFTIASSGVMHLALYGCLSLIVIGGLYYLIPRLTGRAWHHAGLIRLHVLCTAAGAITVAGSLIVGGWWQGSLLADPEVSAAAATNAALPALWGRSMGVLAILIGQLAFVRLLWRQVLPAPQRAEVELPAAVRAALAD